MFLGHFAVGFAAKTLAPRAALGTLFLAAQLIDLLWPTLLLLGVERVEIAPGITRVTPLDFVHYPFSHSLLAVAGWAAVVAIAYYALRRDRRVAWVLAAAIVSHWLLDALVHRPDLPLMPGDDIRIGLGLWFSLGATLAIELSLFATGLWLYLRTTCALDLTGQRALWALVAFLVVIYLANIFGEAPPSATAIAWVGQAQWLLIVWGYWIDRHRQLRADPANTTGKAASHDVFNSKESTMEKFKISNAMRFFFLFAGSILWAGIWLTGFSVVHWLLYFPAIFFYIAAVTGFCPGIIVSRLMFPKRETVTG